MLNIHQLGINPEKTTTASSVRSPFLANLTKYTLETTGKAFLSSYHPIFPYFLFHGPVDRECRPAFRYGSNQFLCPAVIEPFTGRSPAVSVDKILPPPEIVGAKLFEQCMEALAMVRMLQMAELMKKDIVAQELRKTHKIQIDIDIPFRRTASPV